MSLIKAAVIQAAPVVCDTPKTVEKFSQLTRDVAGKGANLVVFPEEIDWRVSVGGTCDLDVIGHCARADVFQLSVDTRSKSAVSFDPFPYAGFGEDEDVAHRLQET